MKLNPFILPIIIFICTAAPAQTQTTPKQVLFDFRVERKYSPAVIPVRTQRAILSKVFRKYLTDEKQCSPDFNASSSNDPLKAARDAGQMVPAIVDTATGSFTAA